jgi:hypothetical protein
MVPLSAHEAMVSEDIIGSKIMDATTEKAHKGKSLCAYAFHVASVPLTESARRSCVESGF